MFVLRLSGTFELVSFGIGVLRHHLVEVRQLYEQSAHHIRYRLVRF